MSRKYLLSAEHRTPSQPFQRNFSFCTHTRNKSNEDGKPIYLCVCHFLPKAQSIDPKLLKALSSARWHTKTAIMPTSQAHLPKVVDIQKFWYLRLGVPYSQNSTTFDTSILKQLFWGDTRGYRKQPCKFTLKFQIPWLRMLTTPA